MHYAISPTQPQRNERLNEMEVSMKLVGKGLQTWRTWRPEQLPFSCFSYTFGFYSSWGPACFLLSSPEASSSCEGLPAEGGKGNICGFRSLCLKTKLLTACLTFGDQLYLHPEHLGAGETRDPPFSVSVFISLLSPLSQALQTERRKISAAYETPRGLRGQICQWYGGGCGNPSGPHLLTGACTPKNQLLKQNQLPSKAPAVWDCSNLFTDELCVNSQTATGCSKPATASWVNQVRAHFLCKCGYEELTPAGGVRTVIGTRAAHTYS